MFYVYMFLCYMLLKRGHISYIKTIFICDQHRIMINMVSSNVLSLKSSGSGSIDALPLGFRKLTDERRCMLLPHKRPFMLIGSSKWQFYEMEHSWTKSVFIRQMFRTLKNPSPIRALVPLCVTPGFWNRRQLFSWVVSYLLDQSCFFHHENTFY